MYTIYALVDPRTTQIRYIGQTQNHPSVRLEGHLSKQDKNHLKNAWLDELKRLSLKPIVITLEYAATQEEALEVEREWIRKGMRAEWPLVNSKSNASFLRRRETKSTGATSVSPETQSRWSELVAAWFAVHPSALTGPAVGISDLARAMCRDNEGGSDANYEAYKGRAHKLFHEFRAAVHLPSGDRLGVDVTSRPAINC